MRDSVDAYPTYSVWRPIRVHTLAALGRHDDARRELDDLAANGFDDILPDEHWLVGMGLLAETACSLSDSISATVLYDLLQPYADRIAICYAEIGIGSVSRYLGLLAAFAENWSEAVRHFETALAMNERVGAQPWIVRTEIDFARMLVARGRDGDEDQARELPARARATCGELGMPVLS